MCVKIVLLLSLMTDTCTMGCLVGDDLKITCVSSYFLVRSKKERSLKKNFSSKSVVCFGQI